MTETKPLGYTLNEPCDNCGHGQAKTKAFSVWCAGKPAQAERHYCEVCSTTHLSKATDYPSQCLDVNLYRAIAWIANELLQEIRRR